MAKKPRTNGSLRRSPRLQALAVSSNLQSAPYPKSTPKRVIAAKNSPSKKRAAVKAPPLENKRKLKATTTTPVDHFPKKQTPHWDDKNRTKRKSTPILVQMSFGSPRPFHLLLQPAANKQATLTTTSSSPEAPTQTIVDQSEKKAIVAGAANIDSTPRKGLITPKSPCPKTTERRQNATAPAASLLNTVAPAKKASEEQKVSIGSPPKHKAIISPFKMEQIRTRPKDQTDQEDKDVLTFLGGILESPQQQRLYK